jgi:hypothetical protein
MKGIMMKAFILCILVCCISCCYAAPIPDLNDIYAKWTANYASAKINKINWCVALLEYKPPSKPIPGYGTMIKVKYLEMIRDGNNVLYRQSTDVNGFDSNSVQTYIFDGKTTKKYNKLSGILVIKHGTSTTIYRINEALECMLLIPGQDLPYELQELWRGAVYDKTLKLLPDMETILGHPCYVVEIAPTCKVWFAPDLGMLPLKYIKAHPQDGFVFDEISVQRVNSVTTSKGVWWYAEVSIYRQNSRTFGDLIRTVQVLDMEPEFPITKDTFNPKFPVNTVVHDDINKIQYVLGLDDFNKINAISKIKE